MSNCAPLKTSWYSDYESWFLHMEEYAKELQNQKRQQELLDGEPRLEDIEDEEEYEAVADRFEELLDEAEWEELVYDN